MASYSRRVRRLEARGKDPRNAVFVTHSKHHAGAPKVIQGRAQETDNGQWIQVKKGGKA